MKKENPVTTKKSTTKKSAAKKTPAKKSTSKAISEDKDTEILRSWVAKAEKFGEKDSIDKFASELVKNYKHDYGTCVHAAAAVAKAAICKASRMFGLTGFQHGCILSLLMRNEFGIGREIGSKILDMDNLLFPQYMRNFVELKISKRCAENLRKRAAAKIKDAKAKNEIVSKRVFEHWKWIAAGNLPSFVTVGD